MNREMESDPGAETSSTAFEAETGAAAPHAVKESSAPQKSCLVVGIGASAGGQAGLEQLFSTMPADCGLAFVVIMHIPPDGPSLLAEILGRYTVMEVVTARDGMLLEPNRVHVIPPGRDLVLSDGRLRLEEREPWRTMHHPIDRFFSSLAREPGKRAVALVLSGFGMDGAEGVKAVSEAGGVVIAQEPATAINPSMPTNAIATGAVNFILPPEEMPEKIAEIAHGICSLSPRSCRTASLDEELAAIFAIVKARTGHDFSSYKSSTVMRRIERRMAVNEACGPQEVSRPAGIEPSGGSCAQSGYSHRRDQLLPRPGCVRLSSARDHPAALRRPEP